MKKLLIGSFAIVALAALSLSPAFESSVLAQTKSAPTLKRRARTVSNARRASSTHRAAVVGSTYTTLTLPADQYFRLRLNQTLSSEIARVGDRFKTTVVTPVYASGVEVVPAGSTVEGHVTSVGRARSRGREGQILIEFDKIVLPSGTTRSMAGMLTELQSEKSGDIDSENGVSGKSSENRKIVYIGGGGLGGAVLGGAIGGGKGAAIGAVLGAGTGVAGALLTKGNEAVLASGSEIGMLTSKPIVFSVRADRVERAR